MKTNYDSHLRIDVDVRGNDMQRMAKAGGVGAIEVVRILNAVLRKEGSRERIYTKTLMRHHRENDEIAPPDEEFRFSLDDLVDISEVMVGA